MYCASIIDSGKPLKPDQGEIEKIKAEVAAKDARIAELEREVSILRSKARVRLAPGELG